MNTAVRLLLAISLSLTLTGHLLADTPRVLVSIKPIHSLVAGVMGGVAEPELLISGGESPHDFTLRPSDARKLNRADLVIWVGEELEAPLEHILENLAGKDRVFGLLEAPGIEQLPTREGGVWEGHAHAEDDHHHEAEHDHHHEAGDEEHREINPHIWLSPSNAARIVNLAVQELSRIDAANASQYRANADAVLNRLGRLDSELEKRVTPVLQTPYIVFHDAYPYFENHYGLNSVGSVTLSPERIPGARRVHELRVKVRTLGARCVFSEPQFEPKLVRTITEGTDAGIGVLDPLGANLKAGEDAYFKLMHNLAHALVDCLGNSSQEH
ncbi:MAG: zinc ABC transporter substrate-binding protein [Sedimenticola sp.]